MSSEDETKRQLEETKKIEELKADIEGLESNLSEMEDERDEFKNERDDFEREVFYLKAVYTEASDFVQELRKEVLCEMLGKFDGPRLMIGPEIVKVLNFFNLVIDRLEKLDPDIGKIC